MSRRLAKPRYRVSGRARQDLIGIGRYTEREWGREQRNHYLGQLDEAFRLIAANPQIGQACDEILAGYRKFSQGSHVIYYRSAELVEIIRVLHERMDPDTQL